MTEDKYIPTATVITNPTVSTINLLTSYNGELPPPIFLTAEYGRLYNNYALSGLAPSGGRVATQADWDALITAYGGESVAAGALKEHGLAHWTTPNTVGATASGFDIFGGGFRNVNGDFVNFGTWGSYWSSDPAFTSYTLLNTGIDVLSFAQDIEAGLSVRMVYDANPGATIVDYEGRVYDVALMDDGNYWTIQNWACAFLNDGTPIPNVTDGTTWAGLTTKGQCAYNNDNNLIPV
jgi:uncharacterized protein (TIGR02145 family)